MWKLERTTQCAKCPWRKGVNPFEIPDGYSVELHQALRDTIAAPGEIGGNGKAMACHESTDDNRYHCIGWFVNQINQGNNIQARLSLMTCENASEMKVIGEQHESFDDTLPASEIRFLRVVIHDEQSETDHFFFVSALTAKQEELLLDIQDGDCDEWMNYIPDLEEQYGVLDGKCDPGDLIGYTSYEVEDFPGLLESIKSWFRSRWFLLAEDQKC